MSDSSSGDKSEKPSQQKLRKARQEGQIVRSRDLATAIGILVSLKVMVFLVPQYLDDFRSLFSQGFALYGSEGAIDNVWSQTFSMTMMLIVKMMLPLLIVPLAAIIGSMIPGGWSVTTKHWMPRLDRLSPAKNLGRVVSPKHLSDTAVSVLKAVTLLAVLWHVGRSTAADHVALQAMTLDRAIAAGAGLLIDGVMAMVVVFIVFAVIDVPVQAFFFQRGQRMTKQEVKEEHKSNEGRPEVKSRIRQLQRQMAQRGVRKSVPTADVIIVNPEHFSVALKYDDRRAEAPYVVAKGIDEMAFYIRRIAAEHGIETVALPPLARAIYHTSQVNQQIPMPLYHAVAQVLTYVLQLKAFRTGQRVREPSLPTDLAVPEHLSDPSEVKPA